MSDNWDANDEVQQLGFPAVRKALERAESTLPEIPPYEGEGEPEVDTSTFETLDIAAIEALPPPTWLVHETISDEGLSIIYGDPGAGKSFIALDMALRIAIGQDWYGKATRRAGVLYIAGEGARGMGKRLTGWRLKHRLEHIDAPFAVLPVAVQLLDDDSRAKLIRTIDELQIRLDWDIKLVIVDTVSRSIAGIDENSQDTMTQFVNACDEIKQHCGGALIGVHHSGKDKERGMRGSSVLLGAVDAAIRVSKSEGLATIKFEKQKDAEELPPVYLQLERVAWLPHEDAGPEDELSTLVPVASTGPKDGVESISMDMIGRAFGLIADAWMDKNPLSNKPQTRRDGRFAPAIFARQIGGDADAWAKLISVWLEGGNLAIEMADSNTKRSGLRVKDAVI